MYCLVTGVAGFIGSHLAERLLLDGHEVYGIDNFTAFYPRHIKERNLDTLRSWGRFTFMEGDLLTMNLIPLLDRVDCVFHLAAQAGVRSSWGTDFSNYLNCNVLVTEHLLEAAKCAKSLSRFVYASSSSVYGEGGMTLLTENVLPQPFSPYGVSKLAGEHLCQLYHRNFGIPTVSLRYFSVYGPRQRPDMALHRFCKAFIDHQPISLYGDGQQVRDFTYVSDVVNATVQAATLPQAIGEVFNIAGGLSVTLNQVLHLLQEISGSPTEITKDATQHGDVYQANAAIIHAERLMGYRPVVSLYEGLNRQFHYHLTTHDHQKMAFL